MEWFLVRFRDQLWKLWRPEVVGDCTPGTKGKWLLGPNPYIVTKGYLTMGYVGASHKVLEAYTW